MVFQETEEEYSCIPVSALHHWLVKL
jgi:hypothetical protein